MIIEKLIGRFPLILPPRYYHLFKHYYPILSTFIQTLCRIVEMSIFPF